MSLIQEIAQEYESGASLQRLCNKYQKHRQTIRDLVEEGGGTIRDPRSKSGTARGKAINVTVDYDLLDKLDTWCEDTETKRSTMVNIALEWFFIMRKYGVGEL